MKKKYLYLMMTSLLCLLLISCSGLDNTAEESNLQANNSQSQVYTDDESTEPGPISEENNGDATNAEEDTEEIFHDNNYLAEESENTESSLDSPDIDSEDMLTSEDGYFFNGRFISLDDPEYGTHFGDDYYEDEYYDDNYYYEDEYSDSDYYYEDEYTSVEYVDDRSKIEEYLAIPIEEKEIVPVDIMPEDNEIDSYPLLVEGRIYISHEDGYNLIMLLLDHAIIINGKGQPKDRICLGGVENYSRADDGRLYYQLIDSREYLGAGYVFAENDIVRFACQYMEPHTRYHNINGYLRNIQDVQIIDSITMYPQIQLLSNFTGE